MYLAHWQLDARPFACDFERRTFYAAPGHQAALAQLQFALAHQHPAALLVGPAGAGKSLLVHLLAEQSPDAAAPWIKLVFPQLAPAELIARIARELAGPADAWPSGGLEVQVARVERGLAEQRAAGRHPVVIIDDAHRLAAPEAFAALRALLHVTVDGRPAMSLILVGQPPLLTALARHPWFEELFGVECLLEPLAAGQSAGYVAHRLAASGRKQPLFDDEALGRLHLHAQGNPRRINRLAELALVVGFAEDRAAIDADLIERVAGGLVLARAA